MTAGHRSRIGSQPSLRDFCVRGWRMRHWETKMNPSAEIAVLEGGVDGIAWEKKREAGMPRRLTRITESCVPPPLPPCPSSQSYLRD